MIPLLAAGIFLGARSVSKPEPPARIESTQKENPETPDPTPAVPAPGLGNAWKDLMEGWRENDDDRFEAGMSWIMARGTDLVPELRERMLDREGSLESRLFAAELLLRIDGKTDRGVVLEAMMDLCRTPGGRKRLANMIKTEEGEIRVYEIARDAIMAAETQDRLPALMEGLHSGDSETRVTALKTLSQLTLDPSLIRDRVAALLKDENPEVRGEALALVPTLFPGEASTLLSGALEAEVDSQVVLYSGRMWAKVATKKDLPRIAELSGSDSRPVTRLAAAHVAASMKEKPSGEWIGTNVLPGLWSLIDSPRIKAAHRAGAAVILDKLVGSYGTGMDPEIALHMDTMLESEKDPWVRSLLEQAKSRLPSE